MGVATLPQEANMLGRSIVILCLTALFVQLSLGQCTFNDGSCMYDFSSLTVAPENFSGAILEYGDGTSCVSGPRVTYITLTCDEQQDTLAVTSVVEAASCAYYINATSKYACGTQVVVNQTSVTVSASVSVGTSPSVSKSVSTSASVSPSQSVM